MKRTTMVIASRFLRASLLMLQIAPTAWSQEAATSQTLTLRVAELNKIDLNARTLTLTIEKLDEERFQPASTINTMTRLVWTNNSGSRKITVTSSNRSPRFLLKVEARKVSPGAGVSAGEIDLSDNIPRDLVVHVTRSAGSCVVMFTGAANLEHGVGTETYVLTYTITGS